MTNNKAAWNTKEKATVTDDIISRKALMEEIQSMSVSISGEYIFSQEAKACVLAHIDSQFPLEISLTVNKHGDIYCRNFPESAIAIVQSWSDAHPLKTCLSDFVEKFPKAPLGMDGTPDICPDILGYRGDSNCCGNCKECWNTSLREEKQDEI